MFAFAIENKWLIKFKLSKDSIETSGETLKRLIKKLKTQLKVKLPNDLGTAYSTENKFEFDKVFCSVM
jgi:hypothetical protein